jgi:hypothetical protein
MSLGLPLKANVRHVFVADDTAQIVVDWSIDGKGPDGDDGGAVRAASHGGLDGLLEVELTWQGVIRERRRIETVIRSGGL